MRRALIQSEKFLPLKNTDVEMYDLVSGKIIAKTKTNAQGIANFPEQKAGTYWYRPNLTRGSGKSGEMSLNGAVHVSELPII